MSAVSGRELNSPVLKCSRMQDRGKASICECVGAKFKDQRHRVEGMDAAAVPLGTIRQAAPNPLEADGVPVADMWQASLALVAPLSGPDCSHARWPNG